MIVHGYLMLLYSLVSCNHDWSFDKCCVLVEGSEWPEGSLDFDRRSDDAPYSDYRWKTGTDKLPYHRRRRRGAWALFAFAIAPSTGTSPSPELCRTTRRGATGGSRLRAYFGVETRKLFYSGSLQRPRLCRPEVGCSVQCIMSLNNLLSNALFMLISVFHV
jgi:hypothetical protein